ncbi:MAG: isocitrate lyase/phosphoenolpyruvate mutase family protein [Alphaproteobacteria bacterium]|nr:isocitrate lyase/phosphoenolpyruvate mutase family protein [Alphaproteobacteria bacterium]
MRWTARRERFRALLSGDACFHPGSVYDAISARIAEDLGFETGMFAGSIASMTVLGAPDIVVLTLSEFADQAHRICRAGELPLIVDADHGYGNALNVMRTVDALENAGIAALTIEDTELPPAYDSSKTRRLIPVAEGIGKMRAALKARCAPGLVIMGRTSAVAITGIDDAIVRARAYQEVGVDAIFLAGMKTRDELAAIAAEIDIPIMLGGASAELSDRAFLAANGVRIALQGHLPFSAGVGAVYETLKALRDGTQPADISHAGSRELMARVLRQDDYGRWTDDYLGDDGATTG